MKRLLELVGNGIDHVVHTAGDGLATMKLEGIEMEGVKKAGESFFFSLFLFFFFPFLGGSLFRVRNRMHTYANNFQYKAWSASSRPSSSANSPPNT